MDDSVRVLKLEKKNRASHSTLTKLALGIAATIFILFGFFAIFEKTVLPQGPRATLHLFYLVLGITSSFIVGAFVAWYLISRERRHRLLQPAYEAGEMLSDPDFVERIRQRAGWFIQLRWFAILATLFLIFFAFYTDALVPPKAFVKLLSWWSVLIILNVFYIFQTCSTSKPYQSIVLQIIGDLVILTGLLNSSGGIENPLYLVYVFHIVIAGILLRKRDAYLMTALAICFLALLAFGELTTVLPHYTIKLFPHKGVHPEHAAHDPYFVFGAFLSLAWVMLCTVYFVRLIMRQVEKNEDRLLHMSHLIAQEREQLKVVVDRAGIGLILLNPDRKIMWFNERMREWFGWGDRQLGNRCESLDVRQSGISCVPCVTEEVLRKNEPASNRRVVCGADGKKRFYEMTCSPVRNKEGKIIHFIELIQDVTTAKALESEAIRKGKMAFLGQVAAVLAHEIGNPLSSIATRIRRLDEVLKEDACGDENLTFLRNSISVLNEQIGRIGRIVRSVSQFAKCPTEDSMLFSIGEVIHEVVDILKMDERTHSVKIEIDSGEHLPWIRGNRDQFYQLILNLSLNSIEAMGGEGILSIKTMLEQGAFVVVVRDNGPGLSDEVRANLFSPFFSTKPHGTGLGLFICQDIVRKHGGTIEVSSEQGRGSCFRILLPADVCHSVEIAKAVR